MYLIIRMKKQFLYIDKYQNIFYKSIDLGKKKNRKKNTSTIL